MGKGRARSVRLQVPLSAQDGEEEKAKQWAALREAFLTDRQVSPRLVIAESASKEKAYHLMLIVVLGR